MANSYRIRTIYVPDADVTLDIGKDFAADLARAVEADHPCTDDTSCDIAAALEQDFPFVAAFLLQSATETPCVDATIAAHVHNGTAGNEMLAEPFNGHIGPGTAPRGWSEWCQWSRDNSVYCEHCGAYTYPDWRGRPEECGNCRRPLPGPSEEPEESENE